VSSLDQSRAKAEAARAQLRETTSLARERTRPAALLTEVKKAATRRATQAAIASLANAKTRPIVAAGVAVAAIAYLFRSPILKTLRARLEKESDNGQ
jgi:hypothetical protein